MIQVRNVPEPLHRELKKRSAAAGLTLTDYIQRILEREVGRLAPGELRKRITSRPPLPKGTSAAEIIRAARAER